MTTEAPRPLVEAAFRDRSLLQDAAHRDAVEAKNDYKEDLRNT